MAKSTATAPYGKAALLLAAHGSPGTRGGRTSTRKHAETIAELGLFAEVAAGFLTEKPFVDGVLKSLEAPEILMVPNMAAAGYIFTHKLPLALGLTGRVTERIGPKGRQRIVLADPVGTHPLITRIVANMVKAALRENACDPQDTTVVLVGHGSTKSRESFTRTKAVAGELAAYGLGAPVVPAFLEEAPFVTDWRGLSDAPTLVFVPFLISDGFHASQDIPLAIGFNPAAAGFQEKLAHGSINETLVDGRRVLYLPAVGDAPDMVDIILARAKQAHQDAC